MLKPRATRSYAQIVEALSSRLGYSSRQQH